MAKEFCDGCDNLFPSDDLLYFEYTDGADFFCPVCVQLLQPEWFDEDYD